MDRTEGGGSLRLGAPSDVPAEGFPLRRIAGAIRPGVTA